MARVAHKHFYALRASYKTELSQVYRDGDGLDVSVLVEVVVGKVGRFFGKTRVYAGYT